MFEFLDPRAESAAAPMSYTLGLGAALTTAPVRIGLLANGFADSATFLSELQTVLAAELPLATFLSASKPTPTVPISDELFEHLASGCDALVSAYGH